MRAEAKLRRLEAIVDASGVAARIEAMLPVGARPRQLRVRTLLVGMLVVATDGRPAHLSRVREALGALPEADRRRLGVIAAWRSGPHELTYRQVERTFSLVAGALAKDEPDGEPPRRSQGRSTPCWRRASRSAGSPGRARSPSTGPTWSPSPAHRRRAARSAPTARHPGDTGAATPPAGATRASSATTCRW